jgi:hypothetical protein
MQRLPIWPDAASTAFFDRKWSMAREPNPSVCPAILLHSNTAAGSRQLRSTHLNPATSCWSELSFVESPLVELNQLMSTHVNRSVFASTEPNDCQLTLIIRGPVGRCWKNSSVSLLVLASVDIAAQQRFGSAAVQLQLGRQCRHGDERGRSTFAGECRAQNSVCLA